jgi:glycosyltransferase involved in cell wall biosynthesis
MKIAFVDVYNPIPINSGGDWYRYQLLNELGQQHYIVEYYMLDSNGKIGFRPNEIRFETEQIKSKINWAAISKELEILKPEFFINNFTLPRIDVDIVFFSTVCFHIAKRISEKDNVPLVLVMHNIEWQYMKSNKSLAYILLKPYEHYIMRKADAILSISPKDYDYVAKLIGKEKLFYIPPNVDTKIFNPSGISYNFGKDKFNLLFYGSLDREQNIQALNFIISELLPSLRNEGLMSDIRINIFGSGKIPEFIDISDPDINFLGVVNDPGMYVRGADLVLVPVKNAGGMKIRILESLACGTPVIATSEAVSGIPEFLSEFIHIANTKDDFMQIIKDFKNGKIKNISDINTHNTLNSYLEGDKLEDVIKFVSQKG